MLTYPMQFNASATGASGIATTWQTEAGGKSLTAAIPPEFSGPGGGFSPEDFFALALQNCFVATFKVIAEKSRLSFSRIEVQSRLTVDRDENGRPWMAAFHLAVKVSGASSVDNARRLLQKTSESCLVLNSVKTAKTFEFAVD